MGKISKKEEIKEEQKLEEKKLNSNETEEEKVGDDKEDNKKKEKKDWRTNVYFRVAKYIFILFVGITLVLWFSYIINFVYSIPLNSHINWLIAKFGKDSSAIIVSVFALSGVALTGLLSYSENKKNRYNASITQSRLEWITALRELVVEFTDTVVSQNNLLMKQYLFGEPYNKLVKSHKEKGKTKTITKNPNLHENDLTPYEISHMQGVKEARNKFYANSSKLISLANNINMYLGVSEQNVGDITDILLKICDLSKRDKYEEIHAVGTQGYEDYEKIEAQYKSEDSTEEKIIRDNYETISEKNKEAHKEEIKTNSEKLVKLFGEYFDQEWKVVKEESR